MTQQLYKVIVRYPAASAKEQMALHPLGATAVQWTEYVENKNRVTAKPYFDNAIEFLEAQGRRDGLISWYDNTDHYEGVGEIMFVFTDSTTALLFKLALP